MVNPLDPIGSLMAGLAVVLDNWYTGMVTNIVKFLFLASVPSTKELVNNFFSLGLGGTFGLATKLMVLMAVLVAIIVILTPQKNHGMKLRRLAVSMVMVGLFGYLFFPIYSLLYNISQGLTKAAINITTSDTNGTIDAIVKLFSGGSAADVIDKLITGSLAGTFGFATFGEAIGLRILLFGVLILYPLILALRPLGGLANVIFHAANSAIVVVVLSPPLMGLGFTVPLLVKNNIPGGDMPGVAVFPTIVGGFFAMVVPLVLAFFAYKGSSEVFGSIDTMGGKVDIGDIPPVSIDDVNRDIDDTHNSPIKDVVTDVVGDGMQNGTLFTDMRRTVVDTIGSASAVMGHPYIGMVVKGGDTFLRNRKEKREAEEGGGSDASV